MSEVERIRLVRDGRQFRVEPAMPDELFINDEYGSVWGGSRGGISSAGAVGI